MKKQILSIVVLLIFSSFINNALSQDFWQQTNGPYGPGYVTAINAQTNGNIYVALDKAGLYHSINNGNTFSFVSKFLATKSINTILVNQLGHIFVGVAAYPYEGLYRSTDNGDSWIQELSSQNIRCMTLDSGGYIYAGTNESGIFRSSDNGDSWTQVSIESTIRTVKTIEESPNGFIFASGWTNPWSETRAVYSTDQGNSWDSLVIPNNIYITDFSFSPNGNIVASFHPHNPLDSSGFLISTNNGNNWIKKNILRNYYGVHSILFDEPTSSFYAVVYTISKWEIIRSTDFGHTWSFVNSFDYQQPDIFGIYSNQQDRLFVGDLDGLKYSTDSGYNWIQSDSGFYDGHLENFTLMPNDRLYVGSNFYNKSSFKLAEDKMNWLKDSSLVGSFVISNSGDYFISNGDIYKSTDYGNSWILSFHPDAAVTSEITISSNGYIFAGGFIPATYSSISKIWRSTNNGDSWSTVYSSFGSPRLIKTITSTNENSIIAGGINGEIVRSTDYGETWSTTHSGFPAAGRCTVLRTTDGNIFAGTNSDGLFRSSDNGISWTAINNGINSLWITSMAINSLGEIFVGTPNGVFVSVDNGENWFSRNSGLIDLSVLLLLCDSLDYLYAATNASGVYRSLQPTTSVDESFSNIPNKFELSQNYPNPFNPTTKIKYQIPKTGFVSLKVYDLLGREVATLVNEEKPAGSYEEEFKGNNLSSGISAKGGYASGIYFYKLQTESNSSVKKMIYLK